MWLLLEHVEEWIGLMKSLAKVDVVGIEDSCGSTVGNDENLVLFFILVECKNARQRLATKGTSLHATASRVADEDLVLVIEGSAAIFACDEEIAVTGRVSDADKVIAFLKPDGGDWLTASDHWEGIETDSLYGTVSR